MTLKFGRLPELPEATHPRLKLARFLDSSVAPKESVDWYSRVPEWPMFLNNQIGDCTIASEAHAIESASDYGLGSLAMVSDAEVLDAYRRVSGYDPADSSTDRGAVMQEVYNDWRKIGLGGHKIAAFARVNGHNLVEVRRAVELFGHVGIGITVSQDMMDDFNAGKVWRRTTGEQLGLHAVPILGYDKEWAYVATWGKIQPMNWPCVVACVEEAWTAIQPEWFDSNGLDPEGLDSYALGQAFSALTGQPNPFHRPSPNPTPAPDGPLAELAALFYSIEGSFESGMHKIKDWLAKHGL